MDKQGKTVIKLLILSFVLAFSVLYFVNIISAVDYSPHKQNTDFILTISSNNGTSCNLSTIQYPSGSSTVFNRPLTKNGQSFYTTITSSNFSNIGYICMNVICTDTVTQETGSVCRDITPNGFNGTLGFYILILVLSLGIIIMGYYMEDAIVVILGSFGLVFIGLYILFNGIDGLKDLTYTWAIGLITLCLAIYFTVRASMEFFN